MLASKHAVILGIDAYGDGLAPLRSAAADARAVAAALEKDHDYSSPHLLLDAAASGPSILDLIEKALPPALSPDSALVLYYAGHGVALGDGSEGPEGFLLPYGPGRPMSPPGFPWGGCARLWSDFPAGIS